MSPVLLIADSQARSPDRGSLSPRGAYGDTALEEPHWKSFGPTPQVSPSKSPPKSLDAKTFTASDNHSVALGKVLPESSDAVIKRRNSTSAVENDRTLPHLTNSAIYDGMTDGRDHPEVLKERIRKFTRLLETEPRNTAALVLRAATYIAAGEPQKAIADTEAALQLNGL